MIIIYTLECRSGGTHASSLVAQDIGAPVAMTDLEASSAQAFRMPVVHKIASDQLMKGRREIIIQHGPEEYRLRITATGKLILTK
jgi:hemin uptake protein HemP